MWSGFEQLEAARFLALFEGGGTVVTSTQKIDPMPVVTGEKEYPQGLLSEMEEKGVNVLAVDALKLAEEAGSQKAVNVVLIGAMAQRLGGGKGGVALRCGALRSAQVLGNEQEGLLNWAGRPSCRAGASLPL